MASSPQLPTIPGPLRPIGPELERELALVFEEHEDAGELAAAICAFAFARRLVFRTGTPDVAMFPISRDGEARAVRVVDAEPPAPASASSRERRGAEWSASMPIPRRK